MLPFRLVCVWSCDFLGYRALAGTVQAEVLDTPAWLHKPSRSSAVRQENLPSWLAAPRRMRNMWS